MPTCSGYSYKLVDALKKYFKDLWLFTSFHLSFAVQTTSNNIQDIIESRIEKRIKGVYVPAGGKHLLCFLDDLNMPAHDLFGSQPPLELLRLWIDYGFWYDRKKQTLKVVKVRNWVLMKAWVRRVIIGEIVLLLSKGLGLNCVTMWNVFCFICRGHYTFSVVFQDMFLLASMGPPGGGRTHITPRFQSRFNLINMTFPNVSVALFMSSCLFFL